MGQQEGLCQSRYGSVSPNVATLFDGDGEPQIYSFSPNFIQAIVDTPKPLERGKSGKAQIRSHAEAPAFEWLRGA